MTPEELTAALTECRNADTLETGLLKLRDEIDRLNAELDGKGKEIDNLTKSNNDLRDANARLFIRITGSDHGDPAPVPDGQQDPQPLPKTFEEIGLSFFKEV